MTGLEKNKLLLFPFFIGIMLMVYSWYSSYPLSIDSLGDFVFNQVSLLYWFSLPLLLTSMYMIAVKSRGNSLKWIIAVGLVMTMYSLSYFYYMLPGADSRYFRGLTEYVIETNDLTPFKPYHVYFEWPSFFILGKMFTSLSGLGLIPFEFILYAIIGLLLVTALYKYVHKAYKNGGFMAVAGFFLMMFYFFNFQCAPFSLAFASLFLLLMLEAHVIEIRERTITMVILFIGMTFTHAFVPLFFVLYELMLYLLSRNGKHFKLFLLTLTIYCVLQVFQAPLSFVDNIRMMMYESPFDIAGIVEATVAPTFVQTDRVAQTFSRLVVIVTTILCSAGFVVSAFKGKLRLVDKAVFLSGVVYSAVGSQFLVLGSRAIPVVFVPVSLGASYLFESRFRPYLKHLFLVLLILFLFIPLHVSFYDSQIMFQTKEAYQAENFMIDHYNWTNPNFILAHRRVVTYLKTRQPYVARFESDFSTLFPRLKDYDTIVYTVGLGKNLLRHNYTTERIFHEEKLNVIYDNSFSYIATKSSKFTWAPTV